MGGVESEFLAAYSAKDLSNKSREAVGRPFGGEATKQPPMPGRKGDVPITNHMVDTIAGYLDNIADLDTNLGGGKELSDLAASIAILVETNVAQAKELKQMRERINTLKTTPRRMCKGVEQTRNVTIVKPPYVRLPT